MLFHGAVVIIEIYLRTLVNKDEILYGVESLTGYLLIRKRLIDRAYTNTF